jgi:diguanylate cyclase (GGDEF)-like protein
VPEAVAIATLQDEAGRALDPRVVAAFIQLMPALIAEGVPEAEPRAIGPGTVASAPGSAHKTLPPPKAGEPRHVFDDIARAHRELYVLYEIAQSMGRSLGVADTFTLVSSRLGALVPFKSCALFLKVEGAGSVRCAEATGIDAAVLRELVLPLGSGNVGWAVRERQALLNGEAALDFAIAEIGDQSPLRAALVTPLVFNDECIGALAVYHVDLDAFKPEHQRFLELPNARFLKMHASTEIARARRNNQPLSLIVFDLDEFKGINDHYGHPTGDAALKSVAQLLAAALRPYDVCARYAGDEFVIVLADCDAAEADAKRRELQQAADRGPVDLGVARVPLRLSAGCATFPQDGDDYQSLLARADHRMYQDKAGRKDRRPRSELSSSRSVTLPPVPGTAPSRDVA